MHPWLVNLGLALAVALVVAFAGSSQAFTILVLLLAWFALVGIVALGIETLIQAVGNRLRQRFDVSR